jgi:RimJ/RimL family protein N-acetyltransferase
MAGSSLWLKTERLGLRRITLDDLSWLAALYADPDVMRYARGTKDRAQVMKIVHDRFLPYYENGAGLGVWATIERATGTPIGFHLLNHIQGETLPQVGFFLAKAVWGQGYGTEMAVALLHYGFAELELPRIHGMAALDNLVSQRVLTKIGLHRHGERAFPHPAYASLGPQAWFERDALDWLSEHQQT